MRHQLATVALAPLLYLQGRHARRVTPLLPEPPGDRRGSSGKGARLRLLVTGDSAAAGVGAPHRDDALLGRLLAVFSRHYSVEFELHAKTGATTHSTLERLRRLHGRTFDLVVTSLGVNDVTEGIGQRRWLARQRELRAELRRRFAPRLMVISGLPPMKLFPALPQPLRWYLGSRADDFDRALERDLEHEADAAFLSLRFENGPAAMAADGFHPGPPIYAAWSSSIFDLAAARLADAE